MSDAVKRALWLVVAFGAILVMVVGLWPQTPATSADDRAAHIAATVRCPFCNGESISDATSQVARDLEVVIREQVADGRTDEQIYAYFAERYGESILLSPPLSGWGIGLWTLPLLVLAGGGVVIWRRRRPHGVGDLDGGGLSPATLAQIEAEMSQIDIDIADSHTQLEDNEIDRQTFEALMTTYEAEQQTRVALLSAESVPDEETPPPDALSHHPGQGRRLVGAGVLILGALAVTVVLATTTDRSDSDATAGIVDAPPIDLDTVTVEQLEDVVAANPEIIGMRLALAQTLMETDDVQRAVYHFGQILERERHPEALAWLGFVSFQVNEPTTAENYLEEALERQPNYPQAAWWLANVRFFGLDDPAGAVAPLEALLVFEAVPADIRDAAVAMLAEVRAAS